MKQRQGFTLIELLVVIGIIAILAGVVIIAINPARQFAQARNTQRNSNVRAILDAIGQRMADNQGVFEKGCPAGAVPTTTVVIASAGATTSQPSLSNYDIATCLVPDYLTQMPFDPSDPSAFYTDTSTYDTEYNVVRDGTTNRVTVTAPATELNIPDISVTR